MAGYGGFPKYVSVAEKRMKAQKSLAKLKKKNPDISPVIISGSKLATTWWGGSWNKNLESYADYENRINRGRSYVRNEAVLDLKITKGTVNALVQGSRAKPYEVTILIKPLPQKAWGAITAECTGKIDSLQELLDGKFPKALAEIFTSKGKGLFPSPQEISFDCSCPDWADMCKHVAAALYGIGARLDNDPSLFFILRNVNIEDLISEAISKKSETLLGKSKTKSRRVIKDTDISDMFGIELESDDKIKPKSKESKVDKERKGSKEDKESKSSSVKNTKKNKSEQ